MATRLDVQLPWVPDEILVRVVEGVEAGIPALSARNRLEAGVYAPSFNLWDGTPVLDLLFKATDAPKQKGRMTPVLLLNLVLPKDESSQRPL